MSEFIKLNSLDDITDIVKDKGIFNVSYPEKMKNTLFISGFSSTLKSTIVKKLAENNDSLLVTSPVKIIDGLNHYYFKDNPLNAIHYFYSQFYALYAMRITNNKHQNYIVERFLWDHYYFLKRFNYLHCTVGSLEDFDISSTIKRVFSLLDLVDNYKIIILKNESPKLQNLAINSSEPTRRMCYSTISEYQKYQEDYLDCINSIIEPLNNDVIRLAITDKCCDFFIK